jgi:hypothetical protein
MTKAMGTTMTDEKLAVVDLHERYRTGGETFAACMRLRGIMGITP